MAYFVAATSMRMSRGRPVPTGELHACLTGRPTSLCGRALDGDLTAFDAMRWSARPVGLPTCRVCFEVAR